MTPQAEAVARSDAYKAGAIALFGACAVIVVALGFEHIGGYIPCPLCLQQRWAYYAGIPLLFAALVLVGAERSHAAALIFLAVGLMFLANAGLGVYQAGAEWKFWPGPATCAVQQPIAGSAADLLQSLSNTNPVRCDEASWRFVGLSFAGWNAAISLALCITALKAAFAADPRESF